MQFQHMLKSNSAHGIPTSMIEQMARLSPDERAEKNRAAKERMKARVAEKKGGSPAPAEVPIPLISSLPQSIRKDMTKKLSGMEETHNYKLGLGHPIEYITKWINKYKGEETYWGKDYETARVFFDKVLKYINAKAKDGNWDGEPVKYILVDDWEKLL